MAVPVAIIDQTPVFQRGIVAILAEHGFEVSTPADAVTWVGEHRQSLVLLSVSSSADWEVLGALCRLRPPPLVIAVISDDSGDSGARAVRLGARSVLARQATIGAVERAVAATMDGEAVMPAPVAHALSAARQAIPANSGPLSAQELSWVRDLSAGRTVAGLAKEAGYSERAMYRLLRAAYERLGVRNRVEAIVRVQQAGWLANDLSNDLNAADPRDTAG